MVASQTYKSALKSQTNPTAHKGGGGGGRIVSITATSGDAVGKGAATNHCPPRRPCSAKDGLHGGGGGSGSHRSFSRGLAAVAEEAGGLRARPMSVSCPGTTASAVQAPPPTAPTASMLTANGTNSNNNGNRQLDCDGLSIKATLSAVSAVSRYCFSESGNCSNTNSITGNGSRTILNRRYRECNNGGDGDDESDVLMAARGSGGGNPCYYDATSEAGLDLYRDLNDNDEYDECDEYGEQSGLSVVTTASAAAYAATAAARLRSGGHGPAAAAAFGGGGSSNGGGGGPSHSVKSNGSSWSVKVMADLQLTPDMHGRLRLPSILMFTHRRPPRHARTEAWWTKVRGVLIEAGRNVTASITAYRSRTRARSGAGQNTDDDDDDGDAHDERYGDVTGGGSAAEERYDNQPSSGGWLKASPSRPPSKARGSSGAVGSYRTMASGEQFRSQSHLAAASSMRLEGYTAAAPPPLPPLPPLPPPAAGLPGAVSSGMSSMDMGPRLCVVADAGGCGQMGRVQVASGGSSGSCEAPLQSPQPPRVSAGGSTERVGGHRGSLGDEWTASGHNSKNSSSSCSRGGSSYGSGRDSGPSQENSYGIDGGCGDVADDNSRMRPLGKQLPPLGLAFNVYRYDGGYGEDALMEPASLPNTRTAAQNVCGGPVGVGESLAGEQMTVISAATIFSADRHCLQMPLSSFILSSSQGSSPPC